MKLDHRARRNIDATILDSRTVRNVVEGEHC
jgi:hypothetical protein